MKIWRGNIWDREKIGGRNREKKKENMKIAKKIGEIEWKKCEEVYVFSEETRCSYKTDFEIES